MLVGLDFRNRQLTSNSMSNRFEGIVLKTKWCYDIFGLMRRSALAKTALQESFYGTDKVLLAEMAMQGHFLHVPEPLFRNRRHATQSVSHKTIKAREIWNNPNAKKHHPLPPVSLLKRLLSRNDQRRYAIVSTP